MFTPKLELPTGPEADRVICFCVDYGPNEVERALAAKHHTKCFRTLMIQSGAVEEHRYAVAVDPTTIPAGYVRYSEEVAATPAVQAPAPTQNPTAQVPAGGPTPPWGGSGKVITGDDSDADASGSVG